MFTRQDLLNHVCTHSEYYLEIADEANFTVKGKLLELCRKSTDVHFNDVPLSMFDNAYGLVPFEVAKAFKARGDYATQAGMVCLIKEAIRREIR